MQLPFLQAECALIHDHQVRSVPTVPGTFHIYKMHELISGLEDGKVCRS